MDFKEFEENIINLIQTADISGAIQKAKEKYKPLEDWRKANQEKPKNLYEAVIQRETYKAAYIKTFGR